MVGEWEISCLDLDLPIHVYLRNDHPWSMLNYLAARYHLFPFLDVSPIAMRYPVATTYLAMEHGPNPKDYLFLGD